MQKNATFLLQGARFFFFFQRNQFIATLYFLEFPSFHVPFSLGFNDELKEAQGSPS